MFSKKLKIWYNGDIIRKTHGWEYIWILKLKVWLDFLQILFQKIFSLENTIPILVYPNLPQHRPHPYSNFTKLMPYRTSRCMYKSFNHTIGLSSHIKFPLLHVYAKFLPSKVKFHIERSRFTSLWLLRSSIEKKIFIRPHTYNGI